MIFVGHGALLWRAVRHTRDLGRPVDLVCTERGPRPASPGVAPDRAATARGGAEGRRPL